MTTDAPARPTFSPRAAAVTVVCAAGLAVLLTWMYLGMRAVMGVGGSCADGGPYVSAQSCPDGTGLVAIAAPLLLVVAFAGTLAAAVVGAPNLLVPMWAVLFGTLGWNFLEFAFKGPDVVWGWLVCGVMFWAMALPAFVWMARQLGPLTARATQDRTWLWTPAYGVLGAAGVLLGWWSYVAVAT